jgi:hypothetical protein
VSEFAARIAELGARLVATVVKKNLAYGDSAYRTAKILGILWPDGVPAARFLEMQLVTRMLDKLSRIATDPGAFGESPWEDLAGYGLLGLEVTTRLLESVPAQVALAPATDPQEVTAEPMEVVTDPQEPATTPAPRRYGATRDQCLAVLATGPMGLAAMAREMKMPASTVNSALRGLHQAGRVRIQDRTWHLVTAATPNTGRVWGQPLKEPTLKATPREAAMRNDKKESIHDFSTPTRCIELTEEDLSPEASCPQGLTVTMAKCIDNYVDAEARKSNASVCRHCVWGQSRRRTYSEAPAHLTEEMG